MARLIGAACVGILIFVALLFAFRVEWYDNVISLEMPEWDNIHIVMRPRATVPTVPTVPAEVTAAPVVGSTSTTTVAKTEERALPATTQVKYVARLPKQWDDIRSDDGVNWHKLGTKCTIPMNGVIVRLEPWSPVGALNTIWHVRYVSQKNAVIDNNQTYCPINSDQGIVDTDLATFYNLAP